MTTLCAVGRDDLPKPSPETCFIKEMMSQNFSLYLNQRKDGNGNACIPELNLELVDEGLVTYETARISGTMGSPKAGVGCLVASCAGED